MKKLTIFLKSRGILAGLMLLAAGLLTVSQAGMSLADSPADDQPLFVAHTYSLAESDAASVQSQETELTPVYFGDNGVMENVVVSATGLTLVDGQTRGRYTSGIIHSPLTFTTDAVPLWGADLPGDATLQLETRLSLDGGQTWSEWLAGPEAFYPVRNDLHSGHLVWVGSDRAALQFRATLTGSQSGMLPTLRSVTLVFNDTSDGPGDAEIARQMVKLSTAADVCPVAKPAVVSRTDWGCPDGQVSPRRPPVYQPVTHIIVHQTETPNAGGPYQDWAGWVRSVWHYHTNVLWWGDVGYNYLIDPNGTIYEGRAGGDDVVGIHDTHNRGSLAIGFLGCYGNCDNPRLGTAQPTDEMLDSAELLMAWKLGQQGIDPLSNAPYAGLPDIPVIAGGRDVTWTSSPGDNLYHKLPELRTAVSGRVACGPVTPTPEPQACQITGIIFEKESYLTGETINLTARLADYRGTPLGGAHVVAEVNRREINAQAATGFGLIDRTGEYDGVYANTELPGFYDFEFTASDPSGEGFAPCTATATVLVEESAGTPAPTITPTTTPTATPTVEPPTGPVVLITPENLTVPFCSQAETIAVTVENVADLVAVDLEIQYDPSLIQVLDADPGQSGVQVRVDDVFAGGFVAQNLVNPTSGEIFFAATLLGSDTIDGNSGLISIDWQPQGVGASTVTLEALTLVDSGGLAIPATSQPGAVEIISDCAGGVIGVVKLQGRRDHSGVLVTGAGDGQTYSQTDGTFSIGAGELFNLWLPGYLPAQVELQPLVESIQARREPVRLAPVTLLAGDINQDNIINILDLAYMARQYRSSDSLADLNADGQADILDLALAASNYQQRGPLTEWR